MTITYCWRSDCQGHLGKFPDCLTEALYLGAEWDDEFGTSDSPFGWNGIVVETTGSDLDLDHTTVGLRPGVYWVNEDSLGRVSSRFAYGTMPNALDRGTVMVEQYRAMRRDYWAWADQEVTA